MESSKRNRDPRTRHPFGFYSLAVFALVLVTLPVTALALFATATVGQFLEAPQVVKELWEN